MKWAGLAIPDPISSAELNHDASVLLTSHILAAFRGVEVFRSADHLKVIREVKAELKLRNSAKNEKAMNLIASGLSRDNKRTILRGRILAGGCLYSHRQSTAQNSWYKSSVTASSCAMQDPRQIFHLSVTDAMQCLASVTR